MIVCFQKHSFCRYLLNAHECARTLVESWGYDSEQNLAFEEFAL